ncbi:cytochrome P450 3A24-like isoform X1 [Gracilinanus agilis]|uniref:cytochrome P450 3A24-like isoform X1 n=1 Tax=Gracilinanus agilis TaxID=191870 RepID=UPI001CFD9774|nr:cytochrome P450 3A24-like isoform X1 [Gracilinanus agilis]
MAFYSGLSVETWTLLVAFVTLLILYGIWPYGFFKKLGIPGPRPLPFFGTFLEYRKGILEFDKECFKKYGKMWGFYDGRLPVLAILDPAMIKIVLVKEFYTLFTNRRTFGLNGNLDSAINMAKGEKWKWIRSIISPTFTTGKLKEMFPIIKHNVDVLVKNIEKKVVQDESVNMKDIFGAYSLDVITSTSFGVDIDSINNPNDPFLIHIKKLFAFSFMSPLLILILVFPSLVPILEKMNLSLLSKENITFLENAARRIMADRKKSNSRDRVDFLQLMIDSQVTNGSVSEERNNSPKALTEKEIVAQAVTFLFAGYETTSTTLNFITYNLATHPEIQKKLLEEIDSTLPNKAVLTYDTIFQMEYLDMVVNETLRLFPLGGRIERICQKTAEINGITIPKGTVVLIPVYVLHHDPEYWPEPEEFRPERFDREGRKSMDPYVFLPFGAGPRNCVGMRFALLTLKTALVTLLQNFTVEPCKETPIPLVIDTKGFMQPKKPIILKLVPRPRPNVEE